MLAGGARCAPPSAPEPPLWKWDVRRGGALLRPRRQGKAAALPCPRMPTVVERPALRPPHAAFRMTLSFSRRGRRPRRPATIPLLPHNQKSGRWYITHHRSLLYCHACLNRLRNSTVLGFCGRSKMLGGGALLTDDAVGHVDYMGAMTSRAKAISWVTTSMVMPLLGQLRA